MYIGQIGARGKCKPINAIFLDVPDVPDVPDVQDVQDVQEVVSCTFEGKAILLSIFFLFKVVGPWFDIAEVL